MKELWQAIVDWFFGLGPKYGVNPIIFGAIYVGAIPFFSISIAWLVRNIKAHKSVVAPILSAGFFFVSAYLYLIFAGKNIPIWVYFFLAALLIFGVLSTVAKVRKGVAK